LAISIILNDFLASRKTIWRNCSLISGKYECTLIIKESTDFANHYQERLL
jgi:hypothetical protein